MRLSLDPRAILLAHTLPALLLFFLYADLFPMVRPALEPEGLAAWGRYAWALGITSGIATLYALQAWLRKQRIHPVYGLLTFLVYVPLLVQFMDADHLLWPGQVARWMVPEEARLYAIRLLSAPLLHALFVVVARSLPAGAGAPARDILIAVAIPFACYLFVQVVQPFRYDIAFERHAWVVVMVLLVVGFLFFLFRGITALLQRRSAGPLARYVLYACAGLVLPLIGLLVNNEHGSSTGGVFGDLSHWGFFVVATLNGLVVLWPASEKRRIRTLQFVLRAIGFSYVLYFFILFLPFLPLSVIAIVALGTGLLLLAPVLLFLVQGSQLLADLRFLRKQCPLPFLLALFFACLLVLPTMITGKYLWHRSMLHNALDNVYASAPEADLAPPHQGALRAVLEHVAANKERRGWAAAHTPFLTPWYNHVVLDGQMLSDHKLNTLRRIFLDSAQEKVGEPPMPRWADDRATAVLDTLTTRSSFDPDQGVWRTWVDMTMHGAENWQSEYRSTFNLPDGAYISDQYLTIAGRQEKGILAERKAATWTYQQIIAVREDPSLTTYAAPGIIELRVFPFAPREVRTAGFELLHKEPFELVLDGCALMVGDSTGPTLREAVLASDGTAVYIPSALKEQLPTVQRPPHLHIVLDATSGSPEERARLVEACEGLITAGAIPRDRITLHRTDARVSSFPWSEEAMQAYPNYRGQGGFFSERAVRRALRQHEAPGSNTRPVLLLLSTRSEHVGVLGKELIDAVLERPEAPDFFTLAADGSWEQRSFRAPGTVVARHADPLKPETVYAWPSKDAVQAWIPHSSGPSVRALATPSAQPTLQPRTWRDALALEGRWRHNTRTPEGGTAAWLATVRASFQTQVLSPVTAWICLENETQRAALQRKQEAVLNASATMDAAEDEPLRMSEPGWLWTLVLPVLWLLRRRS